MNLQFRNTIISADTQKLITAGVEKLIKLLFQNFSQKYIWVLIFRTNFKIWGHFWFEVWVKIESPTVV